MIVSAGLGTRMMPLTDLLPKPALPVRGLPLIAYQLALLAHHGVSEVAINTHRHHEKLEEAARAFCPSGVSLVFSHEQTLLDTGGGIRRMAHFLRESDPCVILGGDQILDTDLTRLVAMHHERNDAVTLLLVDDPRSEEFGSIGIDSKGALRRVAGRFDLGGETCSGLYTWVNVVSPRAFDSLPEREVFGHIDDWLIPLLATGASDIRGHVATPENCLWVPVGTLPEYLTANLESRTLSYLDAEGRAELRGVRFLSDVVIGAGAKVESDARLRNVVIWDGEHVPAIRVDNGIFADATFHRCDLANRPFVNIRDASSD
ncbi:NDP-sugar synthase [Myxococcota bacterium]|nr:NDP-sugar synthase [Myxococcota bacterium]